MQMMLTYTTVGAKVDGLLYSTDHSLERYTANDSPKYQCTLKMNRGNCLFSGKSRIFASCLQNIRGWHDTVCGNLKADKVAL